MKIIVGFFFLGLIIGAPYGSELKAQTEAFPSKPRITWVAPFSPGGGVDVLTRAMAREVTRDLGATVVVQNIPGGGARIGTSHVYRSQPDGHALGTFVVGTLIIPQIIFGEAPYDVRQFVWIASPYRSPFGVWVAANSPYKSLSDLKKIGRPVFIAETDVTATAVPPAVMIMRALGLEYKYITGFGGQALMNPAVMRGEADLFVRSIPSQMPWFKDMRNIATLGPSRHPLTPEVPTLMEQLGGVAADVLPLGSAIFLVGAPPGTPPQAAQALERSILKAVEAPVLRNWAEKAGFIHDLQRVGATDTKKIIEEYIGSLNRHAGMLKAVMKR
ncbi:MAG TPA: tripartite tricarboxylate transporter substrate binding protein [Verrucomicrobiae bacterium]|nr:tripartite tricarboxylate transporter substrate binding protein [Verrucomicrobiae bacterium]